MEHVEELLKLVNKTPKKLSDLNDISRLKEIYTASDPSLEAPKLIRQTIVLTKFRNMDLEYGIDQYCSKNIFGTINLPKVHQNRSLE